MKSIEEQLALIKRGTVEIISEEELVAKLEKGNPLRIKAGFDPTAPDLHLGHTVLLNKLRQFQELGHQVIFLIGDFTAKIGDPSGRLSTRPPLSDAEIKKNVKTYEEQVFKILDRKKAEVRFNSEWLDKLGAAGLVKLAGRYTVARILERDDFSNRYKKGEPLSVHEFLYPLLQGWDSVVLKADVELGGTDQKFNLLVGRQFQREEGQAPQVVMTMPLLEGTDGVQKMSKSYGNYIGIDEPPKDIFGKIMSISDLLMWRYYELLSTKEISEIEAMKKKVEEGDLHPKEVKTNLAKEMVARFHSQKEAERAGVEFEAVFKSGALPEEIEEFKVHSQSDKIGLLTVMTQAGLTPSNSEARRMVVQGGVRLNREKVSDPQLQLSAKGEYLMQVGKRKIKKIKFL
ncbi:MAG: tyrosine--tRNA ligase [Deltaproteobacteria bacterium]|nr:tyrosine--tRNA ligase [Deltaproteobacteria bacterium]